MNRELIPSTTNRAMLIPPDMDKDKRHRLSGFTAWLDAHCHDWSAPDLAAYRDHLLNERGLSPTSVQSHLATIRSRYKALLRDNAVRDGLYALTPPDASGAERKAFVDEVLQRLRNATDPATAIVKVVVQQDRLDTTHLRLSAAQANALLDAPGVSTSLGLRDTAILALLLCTGLREAELCHLDVADLRQHYGGALALHVREGKGAKGRLVPYGELEACLAYVEAWLSYAQISVGAVFRGFYKDGKHVRPSRLTPRAVQNILKRYPVIVDGRPVTATPHDLRRTYARRLYDAGVELMAIQQNLGHSNLRTTQVYVGALDVEKRRPPAIYRFPHLIEVQVLQSESALTAAHQTG